MVKAASCRGNVSLSELRGRERDPMKSVMAGLVLGAVLLGAHGVSAQATQRPTRPNFVIIVVDSMGYGDSEPFGVQDIRTPALNRLAREGVRLTDGYSNGPVCTPTRAAFMTGRYQQRIGLEWALLKDRKDAGLSASEISIATVLKDAGYATGIFGKWHLGYTPSFSPNANGFAEFFGILDFSVDYYSHKNIDGEPDLHENGRLIDQPGYMTDLITERAIRFIQAHAAEPFFAYVPYNAMVLPIQPPDRPDDIRTRETWDRATRKDYTAMVERVDQGVGRILETLDTAGVSQNTLVVFTNDHGGQWYSRREPMFHEFGTVWEGGIRVPYLLRWPGRLPAGQVSSQVVLTMDLTASILAASGARMPDGRTLDGVDVLPVLRGERPQIERAVFWRVDHQGRRQKAARKGNWKYITDNGPELLFDMATDPSERRDLAYERRDLLLEMRALVAEWEAEIDRVTPPFVVK